MLEAMRPYADGPEQWWLNRWLDQIGIHVNYLAPHRLRRFRGHAGIVAIRRWLPRKVFDGLFKFAFVRNPWDRIVSQYHYTLSTPAHHNHRLVSQMEFAEFVDWWTRREKAHQLPMVADRGGRILCDFVGRFESLHRDFNWICRALGMRFNLGHRNRSRHCDFRSYYDRRTRRLVADRLAADVDAFEYSFDDELAAAA